VTKVTAALAAYNLAMYFTIVILNEVNDLILLQSAFADSSLKEGAIEDSWFISPRKHSRIAILGASALLLVSSPQHLTSSATGGVSVLRPRMTNGLQFIKQPLRVGVADPPPLTQGRL